MKPSLSLSPPTLSVILLNPDPGCLACKRETDRQRRDRREREWQSSWYEERNRGAKYRSGDRRRGERGDQSTEVGTEEEDEEDEEEEEQKWGCVFLSFFLFFSFFLFLSVCSRQRGFSFQNISGFVSLGLGRWTGDHPQEDLAKFGYMSK